VTLQPPLLIRFLQFLFAEFLEARIVRSASNIGSSRSSAVYLRRLCKVWVNLEELDLVAVPQIDG
jgi:hypothetical protein